MRITELCAGSMAVALLCGTAQAATRGFIATTTCLTNCAAAGLASGQEVRTYLRVDDGGFSPGGFLQNSDLLNFRVSFGGDTLTSSNAFGYSFFGQWGATHRAISNFSFQAAMDVAPDEGPAFGISDLMPSAFTRNGFCFNVTCGLVELGNSATATPATISAIPLPPALLLVFSAVAGLSFLGRRPARGRDAAGRKSAC